MKKSVFLAVVLVLAVGFTMAAIAADAPAAPAAKAAAPEAKAAAPAGKVAPPAAKAAAPGAKAAAPAGKVAPPAAKAAAKASAKDAKPATPGIKCTLTGKVESVTEKNKQGKEVKRCDVKVAEAKGADGKALDALKGKALRIVGPKTPEAEKLIGKDVEIAGEVVNMKRIRIESIKEGAAPAEKK